MAIYRTTIWPGEGIIAEEIIYCMTEEKTMMILITMMLMMTTIMIMAMMVMKAMVMVMMMAILGLG